MSLKFFFNLDNLGRPFNYIFNAIQGGAAHGIINVDGEKWKEQRRFSLSVLRNFGVGRTLMEDKIGKEIDILINNINELIDMNEPSGINIILALKFCVGNIITSLVFGKTFPIGDSEFDHYQKSIDENFRLLNKAQLLTHFPFLRYITPDGCNYNKIVRNALLVSKFLQKEIKEHWEDVKNSAEITDFTHAYIKEMQSRQKDPNSYYSDKQLEGVVGDIFVAGQETTVTTLAWGLLFFLHYPEVQEKIQSEIAEKVGCVPKWADRTKLPYTCAAIEEIQRLADIAPIGVPHSTLEATLIGGFKIPKGTVILPNLYAIHNDPRYFPDPKQFRPERFLDATGNLAKLESVLPFSVGKRVCLGESLARMELFLIITSLLAKYTFSPLDSTNLPTLDPVFGFTLAPKPFRVLIKPH